MNKEGRYEPPEYRKGNSNNTGELFKRDQKLKRYGEDALNRGLLGRKVKLTLLNDLTIEGNLSNLGMYDLSISQKVQEKIGPLIREMDKVIIVLKSGILTVEVLE